MSSGAMMSNVGNPQVYNDGDQRTYKKNEGPDQKERYDAGQPNSHQLLDSKDERSLGNTLAAAQKAEKEEEEREQEDSRRDPREAAERHGNKPSRGAEIDAELKHDDELRLKEKGIA